MSHHEKILFVDDDPKILKGICRQLDGELDFETANSPIEALKLLEQFRFAVVVSDMRMPEMNGVELLKIVRERYPDAIRMMLTGFADLESTIQAVNEGNIYRFLSKPCSRDILKRAIDDGLKQYRLVHAERELLEGTLHGSIKVLSEMLSLVNPLAFGRTFQVQKIAMAIAEEIGMQELWDLRIACLLFPLGCVTVSESAMECLLKGESLSEQDEASYSQHSALAKNMLQNIPRLETVARIIEFQDQGFDGSGYPTNCSAQGDSIPLGARVLKVASDFEIATKIQGETMTAMLALRDKARLYDPQVIRALEQALHNGLCETTSKRVQVRFVVPGMVLANDLRGKRGQLLIAKGQTVSESLQRRLMALWSSGTIEDTVEIESLLDLEPAAHMDDESLYQRI